MSEISPCQRETTITLADLRFCLQCIAKVKLGMDSDDFFVISQHLEELNDKFCIIGADSSTLWDNLEQEGFIDLLFSLVLSSNPACLDAAVECVTHLSCSKRETYIQSLVNSGVFSLLIELFITREDENCSQWAAVAIYHTIGVIDRSQLPHLIPIEIIPVLIQRCDTPEVREAFWLSRLLARITYLLPVRENTFDIVSCCYHVMQRQNAKMLVKAMLDDLVMLAVCGEEFVQAFFECNLWQFLRCLVERDGSGLFFIGMVKLRKLGLAFLKKMTEEGSYTEETVLRLIHISDVHRVIKKTTDTKTRVSALQFAAELLRHDPRVVKSSETVKILSFATGIGWNGEFEMKQASFQVLLAAVLADSGEIFVGEQLEIALDCLIDAMTWDDHDSDLISSVLDGLCHLLSNRGVLGARVREFLFENQIPDELERMLATSPPPLLAEKMQLLLQTLST